VFSHRCCYFEQQDYEISLWLKTVKPWKWSVGYTRSRQKPFKGRTYMKYGTSLTYPWNCSSFMKTRTEYAQTNYDRQIKCNRHCLPFNSGKVFLFLKQHGISVLCILHTNFTEWIRACLSLETTQQMEIKFGISILKWSLSEEFIFDPFWSHITHTLHKTPIQLYHFCQERLFLQLMFVSRIVQITLSIWAYKKTWQIQVYFSEVIIAHLTLMPIY
jgi:hypothetical protein